MKITTKVWGTFILALSLGLSLSFIIYVVGNQVKEESRNLVQRDLPRLIEIRQLRSSLVEHERLLYEYYATADRRVLWPEILMARESIQKSLNSVNQYQPQYLGELSELFNKLDKVRLDLDRNLGQRSVDWDLARSDLEILTALGDRVDVFLHDLTWQVEEGARSSEKAATSQVTNMTYWVFIFSGFVSVVAAFVGYYFILIIKDAAKRKDLALIAERNPIAILKLNWLGEIIYFNQACERLLFTLGFSPDEVGRLLPENVFNKKTDPTILTQGDVVKKVVINGKTLKYDLAAFSDLQRIHIQIDDISHQEKAKAQLKFQALHDVSTGLQNRRAFENKLEQLIEKEERFSIALLSMDRFKLITTEQGYDISEKIIQRMSLKLLALAKDLTSDNELYRLEGNTFAIVFTSPNDHVSKIAADIQMKLEDPLLIEESRFYITLSIGISHWPKDDQSLQGIVGAAHSALSQAKRIGDHIEEFRPLLHNKELSFLPIESGMRRALEQQEFELHYQGKVDTTEFKTDSAEALIRWKTSSGEMISPGVFIPVAEQTGLIIRIGEWVIKQAFRQSVIWAKQNINVKIALNLSARQFQNRHFLENIREWVVETGVNPSKIELEITEGLLMENVDQSIVVMKSLKEMGFDIAIDDFGTGYSSLSYLKQFPIDTLKIDRAFIQNLEEGKSDQSIVRAITDLAKHLGLKVVAEGVETAGQCQFLQQCGCDLIQGFLFYKPASTAEFEASLSRDHSAKIISIK